MGISYSLEIFFGVVLLQIPSANQYDIIWLDCDVKGLFNEEFKISD